MSTLERPKTNIWDFKAYLGALTQYYETNEKTTFSDQPLSPTHPKHGTDPSESEVFDRPELQMVLRGIAAAKVPEPYIWMLLRITRISVGNRRKMKVPSSRAGPPQMRRDVHYYVACIQMPCIFLTTLEKTSCGSEDGNLHCTEAKYR